MRIRRSVLTRPGRTRKRHGKGFRYYGIDGKPLKDKATVHRVNNLVIPPAWKNSTECWKCPPDCPHGGRVSPRTWPGGTSRCGMGRCPSTTRPKV